MARHPEIYATPEWKESRLIAIQKANGLCEECIKQGKIEAGKEVDHIIELTDDNKHDWNIAYNPDNLQYLCASCHNVKHGRCTGLHMFTDPV
ncbi:HNH endonuclease [Virgibacillus siamensis]|uniref:HNH endonuclease n=1 Tax=Virgibacillus siamensis TaxID=480071 RepID=UPI00362606A6